MPIEIDGLRIPMKDIEGTDLHSVHLFLNKVKGKAALMVYINSDNEIEGIGVWRTAKALYKLEDHLNVRLKKK